MKALTSMSHRMLLRLHLGVEGDFLSLFLLYSHYLQGLFGSKITNSYLHESMKNLCKSMLFGLNSSCLQVVEEGWEFEMAP